MNEIKQEGKFQNLVLDTINQLMSDSVIAEYGKGKLTYDQWKNYAIEILDIANYIRTLPNTITVGILGYEASGKTVGTMFLNPEETYYVNLDKKPLTYTGWKSKYKVGTIEEGSNYNDSITNYDTLKKVIDKVWKHKKEPLIVYILGHIEDYKTKEGMTRQRLRVAGKMAHNYNIDGLFTHCYYSHIDNTKEWNDPNRYQLLTTNLDGNSTARSPMGMWDSAYIPNNLQKITDKILEEYK